MTLPYDSFDDLTASHDVVRSEHPDDFTDQRAYGYEQDDDEG